MWQYKCRRKKKYREKKILRVGNFLIRQKNNIESWKVYHHMEPRRQPTITDKVHTFRSTEETFISRTNYIVGNSKMPLSSPWGNHWKKIRDQYMLPAGCIADDYRELGVAHVCGPILWSHLCIHLSTFTSKLSALQPGEHWHNFSTSNLQIWCHSSPFWYRKTISASILCSCFMSPVFTLSPFKLQGGLWTVLFLEFCLLC